MNIKELLNKIRDGSLNSLFPSDIKCIFCGAELKEKIEDSTCEQCRNSLPWNNQICLTCGTPVVALAKYCLHCKGKKRKFTIARAPFVYTGMVNHLIHRYKYDNERYLAKYIAIFMAQCYREVGFSADIIIAVPLYKKKQKQRGFNQAELIAKELSKLLKIPLCDSGLKRIKDTKTQTKLSFQERQENLENAFEATGDFKGKNILIVDDIFTTGSTISSCCEVLKNKKCADIFSLTFAHTDFS